MLKMKCLSCEQNVRIPQAPKMGLLVKCPHCKARLKVVGTRPVELDFDDEEYEIPEKEEPDKPWRRIRGAKYDLPNLGDNEDEE